MNVSYCGSRLISIICTVCILLIPAKYTLADDNNILQKNRLQVKQLIENYLENEDLGVKDGIIGHLKDLSGNSPKALKRFLKESFPYTEAKHAIYQKKILINGLQKKYFLYVPKGYSPEKQTPAIVSLHGVGESGAAFMKLWLKYSTHKNRYIFICPNYNNAYWWQPNGEKLLMEILKEVSIEYNIDSNRVYLTGFSSGAHGVWFNAIRHPDLFAAAVVMAGECPIPSQLANLQNVPIYIIHGSSDGTIPVEAARDAKKRLEDLSYKFDYMELPEMRHAYPLQKFNTILDWLSKKERTQNPHTVKYTGNVQSAQSVYWLRIDEAINVFGLPDEKEIKKDVLQTEKYTDGDDLPTIEGEINGNDVNVTCSGIKKFSLLFDDESFATNGPINVFVNKQLKFSGNLTPDISNILKSMNNTFDRNRLYTMSIDIEM